MIRPWREPRDVAHGDPGDEADAEVCADCGVELDDDTRREGRREHGIRWRTVLLCVECEPDVDDDGE